MKMSTGHKIGLAAGVCLLGRELLGRLSEADLTNNVVLVTGGSRGLGLALAQEFAAHNCTVSICARDSDELARAKSLLVEKGASRIETFVCDLREQAQAEQLIATVTERLGRIDILVNNAGIISTGPLANMSVADFGDAMNADFWGVLYPTLAVLPQMRARQQGRIVTITSIGGKVSVPHLLPYSCAKFAATGFSEGLRAEVARDGIIATTIVPGLLRTGSFVHAYFKGNHAGEYDWFSVGDNIPGLSLGARGAARAIVQATRRGEAERVLGLPARIAARAQGIAPGLVARANVLVNRALPEAMPGSGDKQMTGAEVRAESPSPARDAVTGLGFVAARELNE